MTHICTVIDCPEGANYFVIAQEGNRVYYMAGPYRTHQGAIDMVVRARLSGVMNNPKFDRCSWGAERSSREEPGMLSAAGLL
jgi:hypothetical protein